MYFVVGAIMSAYAANLDKVLALPEFNDGRPHWIVRAGVGFNGVMGSNKKTQSLIWEDGKQDGAFNFNTGYVFSLGFNKSFGHHPLYWGMGLMFGMRGYATYALKEIKTKRVETSFGISGYYGSQEAEESMQSYNAQLSPFIIGYKYVFLKRMAVDAHVGVYASYDFAGNYVQSTRKDIYYYGNYTPLHESASSEIKISDYDIMRKYDVGMNLGIGYWFGRFNLDFTWQRGFIPLFDNGDREVTIDKKTREWGNLFTSNFQLTLGYSF